MPWLEVLERIHPTVQSSTPTSADKEHVGAWGVPSTFMFTSIPVFTCVSLFMSTFISTSMSMPMSMFLLMSMFMSNYNV